MNPAQIPYAHNGLPGSILDASEGIKAGLVHACGGVCAAPPVTPSSERVWSPETKLPTRNSTSSIGSRHHANVPPDCQTVPDGTTDIAGYRRRDYRVKQNYAKDADH